MAFDLTLSQFVYHYVDQKASGPSYSEREQDLDGMPEGIKTFLMELAEEIWDAPDAGSTRSSRFAENHERVGTSDARPYIDAIRSDPAALFDASKKLADLLHARTHPNASPGILCVMRLTRPEDGAVFVALLKIRYRDEEFIRLQTGDLPLLEVAQVQNILRKDIQKGAIIPHPEKQEYDVKVIDAQSRDDPAAYFTEKFLGCVSKKSDELQIKKLAPVLERYAEEKGLEMAVEKVSQVIRNLQEQPENISTPVLTEAVAAEDLFGEEFEKEDFETYVQESGLGELDIPKERFQRNRKAERRVVYRFTDPDFEGLEISGPPEAFTNVLHARNGQVTFTIETTPEGFKFGYQ